MKKQPEKKKDEQQKPQEQRCIVCYMLANKYGFCWDHDPQFRKKLYGSKWWG